MASNNNLPIFFAGEKVFVKWRRDIYPASVIGSCDDEGKNYDVQYLGDYTGPMYENNVKSARIEKTHKGMTFDLGADDYVTDNLVGTTIRVLWHGSRLYTRQEETGATSEELYKRQYHDAKVAKFDPQTCLHNLFYPDDDYVHAGVDLRQLRVQINKLGANHFPVSTKTFNAKRKPPPTLKKAKKKRRGRGIVKQKTPVQMALAVETIPNEDFPVGSLVWHKSNTAKVDPIWPCIVLSLETIENLDATNDAVYDWYYREVLVRDPSALLLYYLGAHNFGTARRGGEGLQKWGEHDPQKDDEVNFIKMKGLVRKQFNQALVEGCELVKLSHEKRLEAIGFTTEKTAPSKAQDLHYEEKENLSTLRCEICLSLYDAGMMLLCDKCNRGTHVYCSCYILPESFCVDTDEYLCQFCNKGELYYLSPAVNSSTITCDTLLDVRCLPPEYVLEFFSMKTSCFVRESLLPQHVKDAFYAGRFFRRSVSRLPLSGTPVVFEDEAMDGYCLRKYRYMNGTYVGITQVINYFNEAQLLSFENDAEITIQSAHETLQPVINLLTGKPTENETAKPTIKGKMTIDKNDSRKRLKLFLGYRYAYGHNKTVSRLFNDVDPIANVPLAEQLRKHIENDLELVPKGFVNQSVLNFYMKKNSCLGVHQDEKKLFHRPIISIRLFSDSVLSFGCKGFGMQETTNFIPISQPRGTITIMEGWAANNMVHCIRSRDIKSKSLSIIFRKVKETALLEMYKLNRIEEEKQASAVGPSLNVAPKPGPIHPTESTGRHNVGGAVKENAGTDDNENSKVVVVPPSSARKKLSF